MSRSTTDSLWHALLPLHLSGNPLAYEHTHGRMTLKLTRNIDLCGLLPSRASMMSASISSASAPVSLPPRAAGILPIRQFYPTAGAGLQHFQRFADQFSVLGYHACKLSTALAYSPFAINTRPIRWIRGRCFYLPPHLFLTRPWTIEIVAGHML